MRLSQGLVCNGQAPEMAAGRAANAQSSWVRSAFWLAECAATVVFLVDTGHVEHQRPSAVVGPQQTKAAALLITRRLE
jgi:hypothetical protein